jgi:hypothetical protein
MPGIARIGSTLMKGLDGQKAGRQRTDEAFHLAKLPKKGLLISTFGGEWCNTVAYRISGFRAKPLKFQNWFRKAASF